MTIKTPHVLFLIYLLVFSMCAIQPYSRPVWWAENIPIILIVIFLVGSYPFFKFSATAYLLMSVLLILHTIGGHYTFERVPFEYVDGLLGSARNNYDRFAHFTVGFYAYPLAELLMRKQLVRSKAVLFVFPIAAMFAVASLYEIIEWLYAISADTASGAAVLGSQGDMWDAQKDMLLDGLGSVAAMVLFAVKNRKHMDLEKE